MGASRFRGGTSARWLALASGLTLLAVTAVANPVGAAGPDDGNGQSVAAMPADVPSKGLVYAGLTRSAACPGAFATRTTGLCTPGPMSIDMHAHELAAEHQRAGGDALHAHHTAAEPDVANDVPPVPATATPLAPRCDGDGVSGNRVQAIYARESTQPDRYASMLSSFKNWAMGASDIYNNSAAKTGGTRHIRFVHDASCVPTVLNVVMTAGGDDNFDNTITQLRAQGHNLTNRKYMVFVDANVLCGIGNLYGDSSPGQTNRNNRGPSYGRTDAGCWGAHTAAHELTHNLGGVQNDAPNSSGGYHCVDEYDVMCYSDSPNYPTMQIRCSPRSTHEPLLDCNNDDYFHTNPPAGSYLATHWNVANSAFLSSVAAPSVPGPPGGVTASPGNGSATVTWSAPTNTGGSPITLYTVTSSPGSRTCTRTAAPLSCTVTGLTNGTAHTFTVRAANVVGTGPASSPSAPVTPLAGITITGRVTTDGTGAAVAATVRAWNAAGTNVAVTTTTTDGTYRFALPPGAYRIRAATNAGTHVTEFFQDKPSLATATPVTVVAGATTAVVANMSLARTTGSITGVITEDGTGLPLAGIRVRVYDTNGVVVKYADSGVGGVYVFHGLAPGAYRLRFLSPTNTHRLEYFNNAPTLQTATPITVSSAATTTISVAVAPV